jgi:hypothetical protein
MERRRPDDCEESADSKIIQKAKPADQSYGKAFALTRMCAKKKEPPSSDGPVIEKQNRFCPTLQLGSP